MHLIVELLGVAVKIEKYRGHNGTSGNVYNCQGLLSLIRGVHYAGVEVNNLQHIGH